MSAGWAAFVGSVALHGTESGASAIGIEAHAWAWSSAAAHCATAKVDTFLSTELWQNHWSYASWREYLAAGETETELASIRQCMHTGRPLGTREFVHALEESMERRLVPQKGGRPANPRPDTRQSELDYGLR
jgi:hypothetical protein